MKLASFALAFVLAASATHADVLDDTTQVQTALDELSLAAAGRRVTTGVWNEAQPDLIAFGKTLRSPEAVRLWSEALDSVDADGGPAEVARTFGNLQGTIQHVYALEMLDALAGGDIESAREWRAAIKLPRHANAVEGLLALQRMGRNSSQRSEVARMLARETLLWQGTRSRERADELLRLARSDRATDELVALRASETQALARCPATLIETAGVEIASISFPALPEATVDAIAKWKLAIESGLPDLLSGDDVERRGRLVLKLLRLVPMEFRAGVRDGQIVIPIEYREAVNFTIQAQQLFVEVRPSLLKTHPDACTSRGPELESAFQSLERTINEKGDSEIVERTCADISKILQDDFGLSLRKAGKGSDVVREAALEIRGLLGQSLAAAQEGKWREAEALRLEAYTTFDLEIEARVLPRDPDLAMRAERNFLDGGSAGHGIKAMLDRRAGNPDLSLAYEQALSAMDESVALLRVGLSPTTVSITAFTIVLREGLEAVVILAALLAGLRGPENAASRRQVGIGAWGAIAASVLTFILARSVIQSLSRYGEKLEAVISVLAVVILLIVTNWVFHKYYWTGWNARLRELKDKAASQRGQRWETMAMCGVGFLTIYREGFETTLFMQSLILEGGLGASLIGLFAGLAVIALAGWAIFSLGKKLPYRKLLVLTGFLVVSILATFLGSTVRLFQTVGWLPIHPIQGLDIPTWMGTWLGIYPSWEGLLIPLAGFAYVGGAWLWVRWNGRQNQPTPTPPPVPIRREEILRTG